MYITAQASLLNEVLIPSLSICACNFGLFRCFVILFVFTIVTRLQTRAQSIPSSFCSRPPCQHSISPVRQDSLNDFHGPSKYSETPSDLGAIQRPCPKTVDVVLHVVSIGKVGVFRN